MSRPSFNWLVISPNNMLITFTICAEKKRQFDLFYDCSWLEFIISSSESAERLFGGSLMCIPIENEIYAFALSKKFKSSQSKSIYSVTRRHGRFIVLPVHDIEIQVLSIPAVFLLSFRFMLIRMRIKTMLPFQLLQCPGRNPTPHMTAIWMACEGRQTTFVVIQWIINLRVDSLCVTLRSALLPVQVSRGRLRMRKTREPLAAKQPHKPF